MVSKTKKNAKTKTVAKVVKKTTRAKSSAKATKKIADAVLVVGKSGGKIKEGAYKGKENLINVAIADGVTEIGANAFSDCVNLEGIRIPPSVKSIRRNAFNGCVKLLKVEFSEGLETVEDGSFKGCTNLQSVALPSTLKNLGCAFCFCLHLGRVEFKSGGVSVEDDAFKGCILLRELIVSRKLCKNAKLLKSRGYRRALTIAEKNSNVQKDAPIHVGYIEFWSYSPTIGTAWVDSLDEVDDDLAECARDEGGGWGALDVSDIDGELRIDGEYLDIDFKKVKKERCSRENTWGEFRGKIGIYSVDIDKACCFSTFAIPGDFDPAKLKLFYKSVIGPGYYSEPESVTIDLLERAEYDGVELDLEYGDDRDNKGCVFTVFNKGIYAEYDHGCDVNELDWKNFPKDGSADYSNWKAWGPDEWKRLEGMLAKHDPEEDESMKEAFNKCRENETSSVMNEFLEYACRRNHDWAIFVSEWDWGWIIENVPELAYEDRWTESILAALEEGGEGWLTAERCKMWEDVVKNHPPLENVLKRGILSGDISDYIVELKDDQGPIEIHFRGWKEWNEARWDRLEKLLQTKDPDVVAGFREDMGYALYFYCNCEEAEMMHEDFLKGFFHQALARTANWLEVLSDDWDKFHLLECGIKLDENHDFRKFVISWCNANALKDGYYDDEERCWDIRGGTINRWAYVMSLDPQVASDCTTYRLFNGYSRCMLLAAQPQLAERFSLEELGNPKNDCWRTCDGDDFSCAWDSLVDNHPEFAKYRKG